MENKSLTLDIENLSTGKFQAIRELLRNKTVKTKEKEDTSEVLTTQRRIDITQLAADMAKLSDEQEIKKKLEELVIPISQPSLSPTTTEQEDITTAGQRKINLIWETTQGQIAKLVVFGALIVDAAALLGSMFLGRDLSAAQALLVGVVNSLATGVMSFYFSRTNHTQIGGIGIKGTDTQEYKGR